MVRYIALILLFLTTSAQAGIQYNGSAVGAVQTYSGAAWADCVPKQYQSEAWFALIPYGDNYEYHFFVVMGQSNAQGFGESWTSADGTGGIEIKTNGTIVNPIIDPTGQWDWEFDAAANTSAWPAFCKEYFTLTGKHPIFLCLGAGASGLISDPLNSGSWNPTFEGSLYDGAVSRISTALSRLDTAEYNYTWKGVFWWQGETEGGSTTSEEYQTALQGLFDAFSTEFSSHSFNWYCVQIKSTSTGYNLIRAGTSAFATAESRAYIAANNPGPYASDSNPHHTSAEYDAIGILAAQFISEN